MEPLQMFYDGAIFILSPQWGTDLWREAVFHSGVKAPHHRIPQYTNTHLHTETEMHINSLHYLLYDCHNCEPDLTAVPAAVERGLLAAAFEMNKCLMAPWNKAHFQAGCQCVTRGGWEGEREGAGGGGKISSKSSVGKQQTSSKTEADTFSPNVILLKGTIIKGKANTS